MIFTENLHFAYSPGRDIVRLRHFALPARGHVLVVGPSGCGKTTLLHLWAGLLVPTAGRIAIDGSEITRMSARKRDRFRGRHIGIVLQQFHLLPTLTVLQNLLVAQTIAGMPADRSAAMTMLGELGVDSHARLMPHQLSVGQQQRVAIARALVNGPKLLLADEPTSNLDDHACEAVVALLLGAACNQGVALVIATHDSRLKARFPQQLRLPVLPGAQSAQARSEDGRVPRYVAPGVVQ